MHSENYEKVKDYYDRRLWNLAKVRKAVGKWITLEEFFEITGEVYEL